MRLERILGERNHERRNGREEEQHQSFGRRRGSMLMMVDLGAAFLHIETLHTIPLGGSSTMQARTRLSRVARSLIVIIAMLCSAQRAYADIAPRWTDEQLIGFKFNLF